MLRGSNSKTGVDVYSCDFNGWTDVPEEEREGIDAFEAIRSPISSSQQSSAPIELKAPELRTSRPLLVLPHSKAA